MEFKVGDILDLSELARFDSTYKILGINRDSVWEQINYEWYSDANTNRISWNRKHESDSYHNVWHGNIESINESIRVGDITVISQWVCKNIKKHKLISEH